MYLKHIDKYGYNYISCWITGANVRFLLLTRPRDEALGLTSGGAGVGDGKVDLDGFGNVRGQSEKRKYQDICA